MNTLSVRWITRYRRRIVPLWILSGATLAAVATGSIRLVDIAASAGLTQANTSGGHDRKDYILETTGNGVAIFDFDGDGANDIFIVNGTTLDKAGAGCPPRTAHLYRNDGHGPVYGCLPPGRLYARRLGAGRLRGDYDNDGQPDLAGRPTTDTTACTAIWAMANSTTSRPRRTCR